MKIALTLILILLSNTASAIIVKMDPAPADGTCETILATLERSASVTLPAGLRQRLLDSMVANPDQTLLILLALRAANPNSEELVELYQSALRQLTPPADQPTGSPAYNGYNARPAQLRNRGGVKI